MSNDEIATAMIDTGFGEVEVLISADEFVAAGEVFAGADLDVIMMQVGFLEPVDAAVIVGVVVRVPNAVSAGVAVETATSLWAKAVKAEIVHVVEVETLHVQVGFADEMFG
jgi:hypothetical protein